MGRDKLTSPSETGLYYLNSRYYDPEVGRFVSADDCDILDDGNDHIPENNILSIALIIL